MKTSKEIIIEFIRDKYGLEDGVKFNLLKSGRNPHYFENGRLEVLRLKDII